MESDRQKRKIAVKVSACVGLICSTGFAVILGSASQLKSEGDQTKRLVMRFMYFTLCELFSILFSYNCEFNVILLGTYHFACFVKVNSKPKMVPNVKEG